MQIKEQSWLYLSVNQNVFIKGIKRRSLICSRGRSHHGRITKERTEQQLSCVWTLKIPATGQVRHGKQLDPWQNTSTFLLHVYASIQRGPCVPGCAEGECGVAMKQEACSITTHLCCPCRWFTQVCMEKCSAACKGAKQNEWILATSFCSIRSHFSARVYRTNVNETSYPCSCWSVANFARWSPILYAYVLSAFHHVFHALLSPKFLPVLGANQHSTVVLHRLSHRRAYELVFFILDIECCDRLLFSWDPKLQ